MHFLSSVQKAFERALKSRSSEHFCVRCFCCASPQEKKVDFAHLVFLFLRIWFFRLYIVDFSGKNRITDNYHYYGDPAHFNEYVASEVMRIAYETDSIKQKHMLDSLFYR